MGGVAFHPACRSPPPPHTPPPPLAVSAGRLRCLANIPFLSSHRFCMQKCVSLVPGVTLDLIEK